MCVFAYNVFLMKVVGIRETSYFGYIKPVRMGTEKNQNINPHQ